MEPIAIHAHNPGPMTGDGNWTWLLRGRVPTLIDAGTGDSRFLDGVAAALGGARLAQVLVTHAHGDHASGAPALAARCPGVRFRKMPWPGRDAKWPVDWDPIVPGELISAGDGLLEAVHTPGHAPDHLCFWDAASRSLYCGDLAQRGRHDLDPVRSARRPRGLPRLDRSRPRPRARPGCCRLTATVIDDPGLLLRRYIEHRLARERQIVDAMREGASTADEITARVYRGAAGVDAAAGQAGRAVAPGQTRARRPRPPRRRGVAYHGRMNQVVDFINVNRDRYVDELKQYPRDSKHFSALPEHAGDVRRAAEWTADSCRAAGLENVEADRDAGQSGGLRRLAPRARQADDPLLRPLRRAAGRPGEPLDQPALRGDGARRRDLRARRRRRQGPGVHAHQGDRGAPEEERQPADQHEVLHRGRRGSGQRRTSTSSSAATSRSSRPTSS